MRRNKLVTWLLLGGLAFLPIGLWLWMDVYQPHPYWLVRGDSEQDMAYTAWLWWRYRMMDYRHPGTPVFLLHAWLFGLLGGDFDTIPRYLFWSHGLVAFIRALTVVFWFLWAQRQGFPRRWTVLMLLLWMAHPTFLAFGEVINTDSYIPVVGLWFLTLSWMLLSEPTWARILAVGFLGGLMLSIKFSTLPLLIALLGAIAVHVIQHRTFRLLSIPGLALLSFTLLASYPASPIFGLKIALRFLNRSDVGWYIFSIPQFIRVWKNVLAFQDVFWFGLPILYIVLGFWTVLHIYRNRRANDLSLPHKTLIGLLLLAWIYTIGAQPQEGIPYLEYILNLGYRIRNTYPPTLIFVFVLAWIARASSPKTFRWTAVAVLSLFVISWSAFLRERTFAYTLLQALHERVNQAIRENVPTGEVVGFWTTKGLPIVGEAAFHWEGNFQIGRSLFTEELRKRFPTYTLFNVRVLPQILRAVPELQEMTSHDCDKLHGKGPKNPALFYGPPPEWLFYWDWEIKAFGKLDEETVYKILCLYSHPDIIGYFRAGKMNWTIIRLNPPEHNEGTGLTYLPPIYKNKRGTK